MISRCTARFLRRNLPPFSCKLHFYSSSSSSPPQADPDCSTVKQEVEEWTTPKSKLKLTDIPFQSKVANAVTLIGTVSLPVSVEIDKDGRRKATTLLVQEKNPNFPSFSIPIVFEGDMAEVAIWHLKENDTVYVTGMLAPHEDNKDRWSNLQVIAYNFSFVQQSTIKKDNSKSKEKPLTKKMSSSVPQEPLLHKEEIPISTVDEKKSRYTSESMWNDIVSNSHQWLDFREKKLNGSVKPKFPDFVNKNNKTGLWIDSAPDYVLVKLNDLVFDLVDETWNVSSKVSVNTKIKKEEDLWKNLVDNPSSWWDNRATKKSKQPDFKHKDTGEALWLNSRTPAWVHSKLPSTA